MNAEQLARIELLFQTAADLPRSRRAEFLDRECGSSEQIRGRVEALLQQFDRDEPLEPPPPVRDSSPEEEPLLERPGTLIGPYKLLEHIGEGGFGSVFMADQTEPVQRRVALKIIKLGMDTKQVIARFEAERQALAMMEHPNIARVLDAGATETGRPYFVMELVRGDPVTEYCDRQSLSLHERLELFQQICHAVQHAHQKGIIHRDLKPSNVLVTVADGRPIPKVIDFGIAKATSGRLTDKTLFTELRQLIGTPAYMSPEQADASAVDIDTRSDIYSLGVLLYELLTGTTPFDAARLRSAGYDEVRRIIREEEPQKPSTRVSTLRGQDTKGNGDPGTRRATEADSSVHAVAGQPPGRSAPASSAFYVAEHRRTDPAALMRLLRGDLDWIVMKCLEKDRARRYETANGLAADVQHFLSGEPVVAAPPSRLYRFRKFVRRNRAMVTAATVVAVSLLAGMAGTTFGLLRAEQRRAEAETARGRERQQRELAEKRQKETEQVSDFQAAMLSEIDVEAMGRGIKDRFREQVRAALERQYVGEFPDRRKRTPEEVEAKLAAFDQLLVYAQPVDVARGVMDEFVLSLAADALEEQFADQPLVQAQLHLAIGETYRKLGVYAAAEPHLRAALEIRRGHYGPENAHADVAECLYNLAGVMHDLGDRPEAEALYRQSLAMSHELGDRRNVAKTLESLGAVVMFQGEAGFEEADSLFNEALRLNRELFGEDDVRFVAHTLGALAVLRTKQGRLPEAETLNRQILQMRRDHFGDQHPQIALSLHNLAHVLLRQDRHAEAEELFRESLAINHAVYGDEHPLVAMSLYNLGRELVALGRRPEGEALYRQALAQQRKLLGDHHPEVRATLMDLAASRLEDGDCDEAVALLREALAIAERLYPDGDPEAWRRLSMMCRLGFALARQAKALLPTDRERALTLFEEAERLIIGGMNRADKEERGLSFNRANNRLLLEKTITIFEFWHTVAPDRGWAEQAAEWRAELEKSPGP